MLAITFTLGASAQRIAHGFRGRGYYAPVTRVYISPFSYGFGFGYPYFGYPYFGYPPYGYGYPNYGYRRMPYKLSLQIEDINNDYKNQIKATRRDKSLSHAQRRHDIRTLKAERDKAIIDAKMNYGRSGRNNGYQQNRNQGLNNNYQNPNNNQNQGNSNSSDEGSTIQGTKF